MIDTEIDRQELRRRFLGYVLFDRITAPEHPASLLQTGFVAPASWRMRD